MKIRTSFVSNSSSSSFLLGVKNKLTFEGLKELFKIEIGALEYSPFKSIFNLFIECILDNAEEITVEKYLEENSYKEGNKPGIINKIVENNMILYCGEFGDEEDDVERFLCNVDLNYESDELIMEHYGGF